ncbi:MAG TPA: phosphomannomutase/phosphoglucomutase [Steroidobacteraceae bacterium]|nr:phosphomannomutase/phosphoglucomutase [Steroidobacteraceae bacterium]
MQSTAADINPELVRSYDLRGVYGRQLDLGDARQLGLAYAAWARARALRRIAVGRDGRLSSPELERALIEGLVAGGMLVHRIGLGPTPQLHFAVETYGLDGGIMVTGSHNPRDENGFKLLIGSEPVHGETLRALVAARGSPAAGGACVDFPVSQAYVTRLQAQARAGRLTVVWDCGNGAVGALIKRLTQGLPGRHFLLNSKVDGRFPSHHPDPSVAANLRELRTMVLAHEADLGIAFDGDGDRLGVVDESGAIVWPDQVLLFLAAEVLNAAPGACIVGDVKSSRVLFEGVTCLGGRALMAPSGYVRVREAMRRAQAPLAGEMSGHIFFAECWQGTDDALFAAVRLLDCLGRNAGSLGDFRRNLPPTATTPELRLPCPEERKSGVLREVAARLAAVGAPVDTTDGLRVSEPEGWWLLRASGTEPKLSVRCEAADESGLERLRQAVGKHLAACGIELSAARTAVAGQRSQVRPGAVKAR